MRDTTTKKLQKRIVQLRHKREVTNKAFLEALTYVKPFEEVKKLFLDLKEIDAELHVLNLSAKKENMQ